MAVTVAQALCVPGDVGSAFYFFIVSNPRVLHLTFHMNLIQAIRKLERQTAKTETLARKHRAQAEALRAKLDALEKLLSVIKVTPKIGNVRKKRGMSVAGRARIAAVQKKRWAARKAKTQGKGKRRLSAAGRARIIAATKSRWAKFRATQKPKA